jgi:hypothetical protein
MGAEHRIAEQDQHQRGRDHHAERAGDRNQCGTRRLVHAVRRKPRGDHLGKAEHARADRTVHRTEQRAKPHAGDELRGAVRAAGSRGPRAVERVRDRQTVEQQAHQHVERQRLQQIVLEQIDQPAGQGGKQRERARRRSARRTPRRARDADQHDRGGQPVSTMPRPTRNEQHEAGHHGAPARACEIDCALQQDQSRRAARARA